MLDRTISNVYDMDPLSFKAGVRRALREIEHEFTRINDRWIDERNHAIAEATLNILKLNIENLLY